MNIESNNYSPNNIEKYKITDIYNLNHLNHKLIEATNDTPKDDTKEKHMYENANPICIQAKYDENLIRDYINKISSINCEIQQNKELIINHVLDNSPENLINHHDFNKLRKIIISLNQEKSDKQNEIRQMNIANNKHLTTQILDISEKAWSGELGKGKWHLVKSNVADQYGQYVCEYKNLIPTINTKDCKNITPEYVFNPQKNKEEVSQTILQFSDPVQSANEHFYFEVNNKIFNEEEIKKDCDEIFQEQIHNGEDINLILRRLPENYIPTLECGKLYNFGSSNHVSGEIRGYMMPLPTQRIAIISEYNGEKITNIDIWKNKNVLNQINANIKKHENSIWKYHGILNTTIREANSNWSAKYFDWQGKYLNQIEKEEIEYIKSELNFIQEENNDKDLCNYKQATNKVNKKEFLSLEKI
jgi:hypothetical protein